VGIEELDKEFEIEEEKLEKAAKYTGAAGGRLDLKSLKPGDKPWTITILSEPYKVENEKIREATGRGHAWFVRVEKDGMEYDMVLSKTLWFGIRKEMKRHGFNDLKGRTFKIAARRWEDAPEEYRVDKGEVKTYIVQYVGAGAVPVGGGISAEDLEL